MISENNKEIRLTLPKAQAQWLENTCKIAGISKSKYISWCLAKKAEELLKVLNLNTALGNYSNEEIKEIISEDEINSIINELDYFKASRGRVQPTGTK